MMAGPDDAWVLSAAVRPGDVVLEWGSGSSTCLLAKRVAATGKVISLEHRADQRAFTERVLEEEGVSHRVELHYVPAFPNRHTDSPWRLLPGQLQAYVQAPRQLAAATSVDVAFVDGRERMACAQVALDLLKPGGLLLMHDFWSRPRYRERIAELFSRADLICSTPTGEMNGVVTDLAVFRKRSA
jgi:predicted O-methyltransferase YrrM